jgi:putative flippase GtrA
MNDSIQLPWNKYRKVIIYLLCSIASALVETSIGWVLLHNFLHNIVLANTIAVLAGAVLHYFLTLHFVFKGKNSIGSVAVYVITFGLGILLQDAIIWVCYDVLLRDASDGWRFIISKGFSLAIPFVVIYFARKKLYERMAGKEAKNAENE